MSFEELIPLLIGAAYLVFRALSSNKKKQEELNRRRRVLQSQQEDEDNESYGTDAERDPHQVLLDMLGIEREKQAQTEKITPLANVPVDDKGTLEAQLYSPYNTPLVEETDSLQSAAILEKMREESFRNEFKENEKEPSFWDEEAFDMRKAVIYSEILQKKH